MPLILSIPFEFSDSSFYRNFSSNCKDDSRCGAFLKWLSRVLQIPVTCDYIIAIYYVPCNNCCSKDSQNSILPSISKSNLFYSIW